MSLAFDPRPDPRWERAPASPEDELVVRPTPVAAIHAAERRGPLRPGRLISTRARLNGDVLAQTFKGVDAAVIAVLSLLACDIANPLGLWTSPVASVIPFAIGALLLTLNLQASGGHGFRTRESLLIHLARVGGGFALTAGLLAAVLVVTGATSRVWQAEGAWFCLTFASLYLLHTWWWFSVRRLRRSGRLTPNIVVVGATANAARLIKSA